MVESGITEQDVYRYLLETLQPIYADLVATLGEKPTQVVFQFEAAFVHLAVARTKPEATEDNLKKALGHLQRAALDAGKILWLHKKRELSAIVSDEQLRRFCVNLSESALLESYRHAERLGRRARQLEISSTGIDPGAAVDAYYAAALAFDQVLEHVDPEKIRSFRKFRFASLLREQGLGLAVGILAGLLATLLWSLL
ncbi:hypothetical protein [Thiocystis violacea]|uniref:hypothetical protein n=1 Tax=Thiocystis violacea TaxID=13725 RepID=UPI001905EBA3|nr:hypothetical protein [Thiocystis violacea]MBK1720081.1 hypothetical protein [Thiocystis violacea]